MEFGWLNVFQIAGALGIFMYGMKLMSESVQRAAGSGLRQILSGIAGSRWVAFATGMFLTAVIQSSSATTVMTVSFVNAGLLTALESAGLILGANVGTTITGWLVALFGIKMSLTTYAVPLFALGVPLVFAGRGHARYWGEFIIGLGLIFMGLGFMRAGVPLSDEDTMLFDWLATYTGHGLASRLFFVMIGIVLTMAVQSSSVAMAITLTMCAQGWLPADIAASLILGENIGTTSTALLASLIASREAKKAALIHFWFNVIGVVWMVLMLPIFLPWLSASFTFLFGMKDIFNDPLDMTIGMSAFHTAFNLINALLLIWWTPLLEKLASAVLPSDTGPVSETRAMENRFLEPGTYLPEMAVIQLKNEISRFIMVLQRMSTHFTDAVNATRPADKLHHIWSLRQQEEETDRLETDIATFITRLSESEMTAETSLFLRKVLSVSYDLEKMADIYNQLSQILEKKNQDRIYFLPEHRESVNLFSKLMQEGMVLMLENLSGSDPAGEISRVGQSRIEKQIKTARQEITTDHQARLGDPDYNVRSAMVFAHVFQLMERISDHINHINDNISTES
jgi:phosphate:Na+ symporter